MSYPSRAESLNFWEEVDGTGLRRGDEKKDGQEDTRGKEGGDEEHDRSGNLTKRETNSILKRRMLKLWIRRRRRN